MNKYFDLKRFGKYLSYDLVNAHGRFGLSALITGIFPAIAFVFYQLSALVFTGSFHDLPSAVKIISVLCVIVLMTVTAPVKLYGFVTEKKAGSDWLMIPASRLEKFLSMLIVLCVVLPAVILAIVGLTDFLLNTLFPVMYGDSIMMSVKDLGDTASNFFKTNDYVTLTTAGYATLLFNLWEPILLFALGAMVFKTGKVAKTILCCFLIASVLSSILFLLTSDLNFELYFDNLDMSVEKAQFIINTIANVAYTTFFVVVLGAMYYRIKTLKH